MIEIPLQAVYGGFLVLGLLLVFGFTKLCYRFPDTVSTVFTSLVGLFGIELLLSVLSVIPCLFVPSPIFPVRTFGFSLLCANLIALTIYIASATEEGKW